ncbi:MAG: HD domain-containing protein [Treponemataceae bacterium]|nr:HD domain-containing protein [Treponemataceae bacterium]
MNSFSLAELKENTYFTDEVVLDNKFILLSNSNPLTKNIIKALIEWEFKTVYSDGRIRTKTESSFIGLNTKTENVSAEEIGLAPKSEVDSKIDTSDMDDISRLNAIQTVYDEYLAYIEKVFTKYATDKKLSLSEISETVKSLINFIKDNRRYILRIQPQQEAKNKNFLINHAMRTTVFAIVIGLQMKLPNDKLVELGVTSILHEIGMIRLPPQLYLTDRKLRQTEKNEIATHTVFSYNILKEQNFPMSICRGALEHHEKENGKGYPQHLTSKNISPYAKIIAVACSYEAITSPRFYKTARSTFEGVIELLQNKDLQYNQDVIMALVKSISFYPIGAYVYLSDGRIAQVADANPEDPKSPFVQILTEKDENGNFKTVKTNQTNLKITRVLNKNEAENVLNNLSK